jgi:hypothetical protein
VDLGGEALPTPMRKDREITSSILMAFLGAVLISLGLVMSANRAGYVYFVIGPRVVLALAGVATAAMWFVSLGF